MNRIQPLVLLRQKPVGEGESIPGSRPEYAQCRMIIPTHSIKTKSSLSLQIAKRKIVRVLESAVLVTLDIFNAKT
jgi:hypothetical protein